MQCALCNKQPSGLLPSVMETLQRDVQQLGKVAFEVVAVAAQPSKRVDIYLPEVALAIEADGTQHFYGCYQGKPAREQYDKDRAYDKLCEETQQRLVQLHFSDKSEWAKVVQQGIDAAKKGSSSSSPFVMYTRSYKNEADRRRRGLM